MARKKPARERARRPDAPAIDRSAARQVVAAKQQLVSQLHRALKEENVSQSELARRMRTSRAVVHRLLNPDDPSVTLATICRAAAALECTLGLRIRRCPTGI